MKNTEVAEQVIEKISDELLARMRQWFMDNHVEVWWDYDDQMSESQVDMLLTGNFYDFESEIWENLAVGEWLWQEEVENMRQCVWYFITEMLGGIIADEDDIDENDVDEIADGLDLRYNIVVDYNAYELASNTLVRLTLDLGIEHPSHPGKYYDEVEEMLEFFNINPYTMYPIIYGETNEWPNMPERDGNEFVDPKELSEAWINFYYRCGEYIALLGGQLDLLSIARTIEEAQPDGELYITIPIGTQLVAHDSWNGSSSTFITLKREMRIKIVVKHQLCRDGRFGYGVDDVYGTLSSEAWDTDFKIEAVNVEELVTGN